MLSDIVSLIYTLQHQPLLSRASIFKWEYLVTVFTKKVQHEVKHMLGKKGFADNLVGFFIGIMVVVIVAVAVVIPTVQTQVTAYLGTANYSSQVVTLLNLIPLFIVLAILVLVVGLMRF